MKTTGILSGIAALCCVIGVGTVLAQSSLSLDDFLTPQSEQSRIEDNNPCDPQFAFNDDAPKDGTDISLDNVMNLGVADDPSTGPSSALCADRGRVGLSPLSGEEPALDLLLTDGADPFMAFYLTYAEPLQELERRRAGGRYQVTGFDPADTAAAQARATQAASLVSEVLDLPPGLVTVMGELSPDGTAADVNRVELRLFPADQKPRRP